MLINEISIRTQLRPGDIGYVIHLHGKLYAQEEGYGIGFESYVAAGFFEFWQQYDAEKDAVWICEHRNGIVGFLLLMHRQEATAQLRFFILLPGYRNIGIGKKLMGLFISFLKEKKYRFAYLWTASGLDAAAALYKKAGFVLTQEKESEQFGKKLVEQRYDLQVPSD